MMYKITFIRDGHDDVDGGTHADFELSIEAAIEYRKAGNTFDYVDFIEVEDDGETET